MPYETYNALTGKFTSSDTVPSGLSAAQQATLATGVATQAKINAQNYQTMQNAGANAAQIANTMGGYSTTGNVPGLNTAQNASLAEAFKTMNVLPVPKIEPVVKSTAQTAQLPALIAKNQQLQPGQRISDPTMLKSLTENDIRRGTDGTIYRGSLQMEKNALGDYSKIYGTPKTKTDLSHFYDYAYGGKLTAKPLPGSQSAGNPNANQDSNNPPVSGYENVDGTLDTIKFESDLRAKIQPYIDAYTQAQEAADKWNQDTAQGQFNIGQQLGEVAPLLQGEQAALQQQRALTASTLESAANRAQTALQFQTQLENNIASQKMQIMEYNRGLRKDQQDAFNTQLNLAMQAGMASTDVKKNPEMMKWITDGAKIAGYDPNMIIAALDNKYKETQLQTQSAKIDMAYKQEQLNQLKNPKSTYQLSTSTDAFGNVTYKVFDPKTGKLTDANIQPDGSKGGQCGDYVHNIMAGTPKFGDTWQTKQAAMNITPQQFAQNPQVGDILTFKTNLPTGHVAVVTGVNGNQVTLTESNYKLDGKVSNGRTINIDDKNILGAYRGASFKTDANKNSTPYNDEQLMPYAQELAANGSVPSGIPKGSLSRIMELAKSIPKSDGQLLDTTTGISPDSKKISAANKDGLLALYDLNKKLDEYKKYFDNTNHGLVAGAFGTMFPSSDRTAMDTLRGEITDLLARARTGAAITAYEEAQYAKKLPGAFNETLWFGDDGDVKLQGLKNSLGGLLETKLKGYGADIVGRQITKDGKTYTRAYINGQWGWDDGR